MDKKKICVFCKKEFEELSEEHIISNELSGRFLPTFKMSAIVL